MLLWDCSIFLLQSADLDGDEQSYNMRVKVRSYRMSGYPCPGTVAMSATRCCPRRSRRTAERGVIKWAREPDFSSMAERASSRSCRS